MRIIPFFANTMTAARRQRKGHRVHGAALGALMFALFAGLPHTRAATTERIVVDRHTGLAIGGYDPWLSSLTAGRWPGTRRSNRFCNIGPGGVCGAA
jgi:hypothetical protein